MSLRFLVASFMNVEAESHRFGLFSLMLGCEHTEAAVAALAAGDTRNELESRSVMAESCIVCSPPSAPRENLKEHHNLFLVYQIFNSPP